MPSIMSLRLGRYGFPRLNSRLPRIVGAINSCRRLSDFSKSSSKGTAVTKDYGKRSAIVTGSARGMKDTHRHRVVLC